MASLATRSIGKRYRDDAALRAQPLSNWDAAIATILRLARDAKRDGHPLLLVLDEFPRLVVSTPRLPSLLQGTIEDVRREDLPLFLVHLDLFGSIVGRRHRGSRPRPRGGRPV